MTANTMKRASLAEIKKMREQGRLHHDPSTPEEPALSAEFWANAKVEGPRPRSRSVHLKLDQEVFDYFHRESGGKGHLTKMQNVLKAYAAAHK